MRTLAAWVCICWGIAGLLWFGRLLLIRRWNRQPLVPEPLPVPRCPEYMYVDFDDGSIRRCKTTPHPVWGFPTTAPFSSPEWEVVCPAPEPASVTRKGVWDASCRDWDGT